MTMGVDGSIYDEAVIMEPQAWKEVERILEGESSLPINEQAFLVWLGAEIVEEFLQSPTDVKQMSRETGLSTKGRDVAEELLKKMKAKSAELETKLKEKKQ